MDNKKVVDEFFADKDGILMPLAGGQAVFLSVIDMGTGVPLAGVTLEVLEGISWFLLFLDADLAYVLIVFYK